MKLLKVIYNLVYLVCPPQFTKSTEQKRAIVWLFDYIYTKKKNCCLYNLDLFLFVICGNKFQVPLTIPVNHEAMWGYPASPHISLCTAPPGAPPHMHSCHVHNVYPSHQLMSQQFPACLPHQGYGPFPNTPGALSVTGQHYAHQHLPPQVKQTKQQQINN